MKKINISEMKSTTIEGEKGTVTVFNPIPDEIIAGVRVVPASSDVPKRTHVHLEKQLIYVISGSGKITNGDHTFDLKSGDFVMLDSSEEHYVMTENEELRLFEVKFS
ncbi:MAG: cupin domain-containing protein [Candidatus Thorarchaeota archaeon]